MVRRKCFSLVLLFALVAAGQRSAPAQSRGPFLRPSFAASSAPKYAPGEVLVRFRPTVAKAGRASVHALVRAQVVRSFRVVHDLELVRLPAELPVEAALRVYRRNPDVLYAEPNYTWRMDLAPNDSRFTELWGLHNIGQNGGLPDADIDAPEAWNITTGSPDVVVGVTDTGIDYNHEDLAANIFRNALDCNTNGVDDDGNGFVDDCHGIDTVNFDSDPMDDFGHGTHVAGIIGAAGNNGIGVVGVNWQVKLMPCKFISAEGFGFTSGAIACLDYFAMMKDRGVHLVATNNSWGGNSFSQALVDAIDTHRQRGILFIAAAGNDASDNDIFDSFPNGFYLPNIISVAATTRTDALADFSNFGRKSVHLGAPGEDILSTVPGVLFGDRYLSASGTSMAAPYVTGVAALLAAQNPQRDWKAIKNLILAGGDSIASMTSTISKKRLNARGAMTCTNSTVRSWLQPRNSMITSSPGLPVDLAVLNINCAAPNGNVTVSVDGGAETVTLLDNGLGADQEAGDGIYSGQWIPSPASPGAHSLTFPGGDVVTAQVLAPYRFSTPVPFNYRTITGTQLVLGDDDSRSITPGFPILFGGGSFSSLFFNTNGNITFTKPFFKHSNQAIPTTTTPTLVAPFWEDLIPIQSADNVPFPGGLFWEVIGSQPNRELVLEWRDVQQYSCALDFDHFDFTVKFQVVFFEGSSNILFNYADVNFGPDCEFADLGAGASVGVEVSSRVGTQFSFNTPSLVDGTAILWELGDPTPAISRLSPFTAIAGDAGFTLTVNGSNIVPGAVVEWGGSDRPTGFVSSNGLTASISSSDITSAGTVEVRGVNPAPFGGTSNELPFTIHTTHPVPTIAALLPDKVFVSSGAFTLTVTGSDFVTGSLVRWNGANQPTTAVNSTQALVEIPATDVAATGTAEITVFNPEPGGGSSNPLTLVINNPVPNVFFWDQNYARTNGPSFTVTLSGSDFISSSVVRWNGADRPTKVTLDSSPQTAQATIPASDIATPGTAEVTVFNPPPGGGLSRSLQFHIVAPPPNDAFASSVPVTTLPFSHATNILGASADPTDPTPPCGGGSRAKSVWYSFASTSNALMTADTFGSDYDTILSIWTGAPGSFSLVQCNHNTDVVHTQLAFSSSPGTTYSFMVSDAQGSISCCIGNLVLHVAHSQPDFDLSFSGATSLTVRQGDTAKYTIRVTPANGIATPITFSCGPLPVGTACAFSPNPLTPGPNAEDVGLSISTQASSASLVPLFGNRDSRPLWAFWLGLPGLALLGPLGAADRRRRATGCLLLLLVLLFAFQIACGGEGSSTRRNTGTPLGTHTITVNATSAGIQRSASVTLVVQ